MWIFWPATENLMKLLSGLWQSHYIPVCDIHHNYMSRPGLGCDFSKAPVRDYSNYVANKVSGDLFNGFCFLWFVFIVVSFVIFNLIQHANRRETRTPTISST